MLRKRQLPAELSRPFKPSNGFRIIHTTFDRTDPRQTESPLPLTFKNERLGASPETENNFGNRFESCRLDRNYRGSLYRVRYIESAAFVAGSGAASNPKNVPGSRVNQVIDVKPVP